ncbi:MAG: cellulase, partial [Rhodoblastus sp.]|nr:cellulase [Rhodoblastus sp.]
MSRLRLIGCLFALLATPVAAQTFAPVVPLGANVQAQMNAAKAKAAEKAPLALDARPLSLGGALKTPEMWQQYKTNYVTDHGRVVDTGNGRISHS